MATDNEVAIIVELIEQAAAARVRREVRQPVGVGAGLPRPSECDHHDSQWMAAYLAGLCTALAVLIARPADVIEAEAIAAAEAAL